MTPTKTNTGQSALQPPLDDIKNKCEHFIAGVNTLCSLSERLVQKPLDKISVFTVSEFVQDLKDKLLILEAMPKDHDKFIRNYPGLGSTNQLYEANRTELEAHLESQGYEEIKDRVAELIGLSLSAIATFEVHERREIQSHQGNAVDPLQESPSLSESLNEKSSQKEANRGPEEYASILRKELDNSCHISSLPNVTSKEEECLSEAVKMCMQGVEELQKTQEKMMEVINAMSIKLPDYWGHSVQNGQRSFTSVKEVKSDGSSTKFHVSHPESPSRLQLMTTHKSEKKLQSAETGQSVPQGKTVPTTPKSVTTPATPTSNPVSCLKPNVLKDIFSAVSPFTGKKEEYLLFKQMFDMFVHNHPDLSPEMKQIVLLRLLDQETRELVTSSKISGGGYIQLRENLDRQFIRNERDTIDELVRQLQRHTFHEKNYDQMVKDLNKFTVIVNHLEARGCSTDDPLMIDSFITKLPKGIMSTVLHKERKKRQTLKELIDYTHSVISMERELNNIAERRRPQQLFRDEEDGTSGTK